MDIRHELPLHDPQEYLVSRDATGSHPSCLLQGQPNRARLERPTARSRQRFARGDSPRSSAVEAARSKATSSPCALRVS